MSHIPTTVIALLPLLMFLNPAAAIAQGTSVQAIVDSLYPATRLHPDDAGDRRSCYQIAAVAADGTPTRIVAGYTDTSDAVLRVLDRDAAGTFHVSYESPADLDMFSQECEIEVSDIDGDGAKDVFMTLAAGKGHYAWIFRAVGNTLKPIESIKGNPGLVDLYHDGAQQVAVVADIDDSGVYTKFLFEVYRLSTSRLVLDSPVVLLRSFEPDDPDLLKRATFNLQAGATGQYVVRITNGIRGGRRRVTAMSISINGVRLKGTVALTARTEFLEIPISIPLADQNELYVTVNGPKDATALIVIRSAPSRTKRTAKSRPPYAPSSTPQF